MKTAIAGMTAAMKWRGVTGDAAMAAVSGVTVVLSLLVLSLFLRTLRRI